MSFFLIIYSIVVGSIFIGCSGADDVNTEAILEHNSARLSQLENKILTYENNNTEYSYMYCADGELRYANDLKSIGTYVIDGNNVEITELVNFTYETDGQFEKGQKYLVTPNIEKVEVTKIVDTVCTPIEKSVYIDG